MKEEFIGLEVIEEMHIVCPNCHNILAEIVHYETNESREARKLKPVSTRYKVDKCYDCGEPSMLTKVFLGTTSAGSFNNNLNVEILDTEFEDGIITMTLGVKTT